MALGGGTFTTQNKVLPGTYMNFVSAARASQSLSERGYVAAPLELDWGPDGEVFALHSEDFAEQAQTLFGYGIGHEKLKPLRDLFLHCRTAYLYRLNSGEKAQNDFATAKYSGVRGNEIQIVIAANVDDVDQWDVSTLLDGRKMDTQTVAAAADLQDNDYVVWKKDATLAATAGTPLAGGSNAASITGESHQAFLDKIESYGFHTLCCPSTEEVTKKLYAQFTRRMREEQGVKFQTVLYRSAADYEGCISVRNQVTDGAEQSLVYWLTGAEAGCAVNKDLTNKVYDGEYTVDTRYKQRELAAGIQAGELLFHQVGDTVRVLEDINSLVSFTDQKNEDFASNQTIRVLDQIANDTAVLFNTKYLGQIPNDAAGRISFWGDLVKQYESLQTLRAIENFVSDDITVAPGNDKKSVTVDSAVQPVNSMRKLYNTVVVR